MRRGALLAAVVLATAALVTSAAGGSAARPGGSLAGTYRGVIEGFYGNPWLAAERRSLITWIGRHHMNTFVYAPKDDFYERDAWRTVYPGAQLASFRGDLASAHRARVRYVYSISPGLDMCYSSAADRDALARKLGQLRAIGVRSFMLAFDDIGAGFACGQDSARYGSAAGALGTAHAEVANAVFAWLRRGTPDGTLIVVPTDYSGVSATPYLRALSLSLAPPIDVAWTGRWGVSGTITSSEADAIAKVLGRRPVVWDNYPVNDFDPGRLQLGPFAGRSATLLQHVSGIVANPMTQPEASKLPLFTLGRYFAAPRGYLPTRAWLEGLRELAGTAPASVLLRRFAENSTAAATFDDPHPTWAGQSPALWSRLSGLDAALRGPYWQAAAAALVGRLRSEIAAARELPRRLRNRRLVAELRPWLVKLGLDARVGLAAAALLRDTRPRFSQLRVARIGGSWRSSGRARRVSPAVVAGAVARLDGVWKSASLPLLELHGGTIDFAYTLARAYASCRRPGLSVTIDGTRVRLGSDGTFAVVAKRQPRSVVVSEGGLSSASDSEPARPSPRANPRIHAAIAARLALLADAVRHRDADRVADLYDPSFRSVDGLDYPQLLEIWRPFLAASKRITFARFQLRLVDDGPWRCGGPVVSAVEWKIGGLVPPNFPHTNRGYGTIGGSATLLWRLRGSVWRIVGATPRMP